MNKKSINNDPNNFCFSKSPEHYHHLKLEINNDEAQILIDIDPEKSLRGDTPLKLNSYDLGVDIELNDAINRLRFEHPNVRVVTFKSANEKIFSSGANIYMLKKSSHAFKVNFCKFTNETRLYMEEASQFSNKKFLCALNGTSAGGGYELALACDKIILIDDKFASVSLPEVPLLGVLPGTGGLTRVVDKRKVRRDIADYFCTLSEGFKGQRAKDYKLVDEVYPKSQWQDGIKTEIANLKTRTQKHDNQTGIKLSPISPKENAQGFSYEYVHVNLEQKGLAQIQIHGPKEDQPTNPSAMIEKGEDLWLLKAFRELDDAILRLRFFYREHGIWQLETKGESKTILDAEKPLYMAMEKNSSWFTRELLLHASRVIKRLDTSSRSLVAKILPDSNFSGIFAELLFTCDRTYALEDENNMGKIILTPINNGLLKTWNNSSRLENHFYGEPEKLSIVRKCFDQSIDVKQAFNLGLLTFLLDEIDFEDEYRIFLEERASLSPDALSAMEANLRFLGNETLATKIFGRLSAWQNWVFIRENASGENGALICYGEDRRAQFNFERC